MATQLPSQHQATIDAAVEAVRRGYQPIPIHSGKKRPGVTTWTRLRWNTSDLDKVREQFTEWVEGDMTNVGLLLGEPSGNLVDVDLDHPKAWRLREYFLPPTPMRTGRAGRRVSHYWYVAEEGTLQGFRPYKMPDGSTSVEMRTNKHQTLVPPSTHPSGEEYLWEGEPWGGGAGPAVVNGRALNAQVALIALGAVLLENWPGQGGRHDAYLALAGGLLRYGEGVHPWWERNAGVLLRAIADVTHDEEGPDVREREAIHSTIDRLNSDREVMGFPRLAEILGEKHVKEARRLVREVEAAAGFERDGDWDLGLDDDEPIDELDDADHETYEEVEAFGTWQEVDLDPYVRGEIQRAEPTVFNRTDGQALMYGGRVNMLYGSSETAKSWIALYACMQEVIINRGRVVYLDFEDEPAETVGRLLDLGMSPQDITDGFNYVHPEEPLAEMQRNRWGKVEITKKGKANQERFTKLMTQIDPTLIVADGMSVLYGLHGLDTNDTTSTDVITGWLKKLTRGGRSVIVIDHTGKSPKKGSLPIGSQHKVSMVQGTLLQVWPISQPMPGALGELDLVVLKDRPGQVRRASERSQNGSKAQVCARVEIDSRVPENGTELKVLPPESSRPIHLLDDEDAVIDLRESQAAADQAVADRRRRLIRAVFDDPSVVLTAREISHQAGIAENTARAAAREMSQGPDPELEEIDLASGPNGGRRPKGYCLRRQEGGDEA